jgi:hypothetical protein
LFYVTPILIEDILKEDKIIVSVYFILKNGLHGTAMLPWDLTEQQMFNVVQYIKTFAPEKWVGEDKKLGDIIAVGKNSAAPKAVGTPYLKD